MLVCVLFVGFQKCDRRGDFGPCAGRAERCRAVVRLWHTVGWSVVCLSDAQGRSCASDKWCLFEVRAEGLLPLRGEDALYVDHGREVFAPVEVVHELHFDCSVLDVAGLGQA